MIHRMVRGIACVCFMFMPYMQAHKGIQAAANICRAVRGYIAREEKARDCLIQANRAYVHAAFKRNRSETITLAEYENRNHDFANALATLIQARSQLLQTRVRTDAVLDMVCIKSYYKDRTVKDSFASLPAGVKDCILQNLHKRKNDTNLLREYTQYTITNISEPCVYIHGIPVHVFGKNHLTLENKK